MPFPSTAQTIEYITKNSTIKVIFVILLSLALAYIFYLQDVVYLQYMRQIQKIPLCLFTQFTDPQLLVNKTFQPQQGHTMVSEANTSLFRHLKPEEIDDVQASLLSDKKSLASALEWTRRRERKIQERANEMNIELEKLRFALHETKTSHGPTLTEDNFCVLEGASMIYLQASDAHFEGYEVSKRLDGIMQRISLSEKFKIDICIFKSKTQGLIRIKKQHMCNEQISFAKDPEYIDMIRKRFGPDEFVLNLEGPEIHSLTPHLIYKGNCEYHLPFKVYTPGLYHVNLVWYRENFAGAREGVTGWIPGHLDKPLGERIFVRLGEPNETEAYLRMHARDNLPPCDLRSRNYSYLPGRWVYRGSNTSSIFQSKAHPTYHRSVGKGRFHTWVRLEDYTWFPNHCSLPRLIPSKVQQCIRGKKILFEGDSHMRMLHHTLITFACGVQGKWTGWDTQCGGRCHNLTGELKSICVIKDGTASRSTFVDSSAFTTFVNFGQHFCDGERHKTYREYTARVNWLIQKLKGLDNEARSRVVWHETNQVPLRKDSWTRGYGDQRTNIKIAMYNQYATSEIKKLGIPIIPAFAQTLSLNAGGHDGAHFNFQVLSESSLRFALALLCGNAP